MKKTLTVFVGLFLVAALLTACNLPSQQQTDDGGGSDNVATSAVLTVSAQETLNAQNQQDGDGDNPPAEPTATTPAEQPTNETPPTNAPPPTDTPPDPTATKEPCDKAGFVKDVTIDDGTEMQPGEAFTKTWRIKNEGTCTWDSGYDVVFGTGNAMSGPSSQQLTAGTVPPGSTYDLSVDLVAPAAPGTYKGTWQLRNGDDVHFTTGGFWVEIEVVDQEVYSSKASFKIDPTFDADLDDGSSPAAGISDFWYQIIADDDKNLVPENGAKFLVMGNTEPNYADCSTATLKTDTVQIKNSLVGKWFCYITDDGRHGKFKVVSLKPNDITQDQVFEIKFTTWKKP